MFSDILGSDSDLEEDLQRAELREDFEQHPAPATAMGMPAAPPSDAGGPSPMDMYALLNRKMDMLSKSEEGSRAGSRPRSPLIPPPSRLHVGPKVAVRLSVTLLGASSSSQAVASSSSNSMLDLLSADPLPDPSMPDPLQSSATPAPHQHITVQLLVVEGLRNAEDDDWSPRSSICTEAPDVAGLHPAARGPPEPSQKALAAMWELLEGCLGLVHPELEQQAQEALLMKLDAKLAENEAAAGGGSGAGSGGSAAAHAPSTSASAAAATNGTAVNMAVNMAVNGTDNPTAYGGARPTTPPPTTGAGVHAAGGAVNVHAAGGVNVHAAGDVSGAPDRQSSLMSTPSMVSDMEKRGLLDSGTPGSDIHSTPGGVGVSGGGAGGVGARGGETQDGGQLGGGGDPEGGDVSVAMMPRYGWCFVVTSVSVFVFVIFCS